MAPEKLGCGGESVATRGTISSPQHSDWVSEKKDLGSLQKLGEISKMPLLKSFPQHVDSVFLSSLVPLFVIRIEESFFTVS
ncbi:MAG TPA: hypothetical protein VGC58_00750 [Candidatus Paceibacterota bacterium]